MKQMTEAELRKLLEEAFAEGWGISSQGQNAEHNTLSGEELGELRRIAIDDMMTRL